MSISVTAPLAISFLGMGVVGALILYNDFKRLSVKMWMLLLFVLIGYIGVLTTSIINNSFNVLFLLTIPAYIVLNILNTRFNKNRFIGQADVDILNGTLALLLPVGLIISQKSYGDLTGAVVSVELGGLVLDLLAWLLLGFIIAIAIALIKWLVIKINSKSSNDQDIDITYKIAAAATINSNKIVEDIKETGRSLADNKKYEQLKNKNKLRGTKIPVCISFMPMYFYMVYVAVTYVI